MSTKGDSESAMSSAVANCRMNRERESCGGKTYTRVDTFCRMSILLDDRS
jgi:hypothetical protein